VEELINIITDKVISLAPGNPFFGDTRYKPYPLNKENVNKINLRNDSQRKLAFIDGGNNCLLALPNFSIHLVRVYFNIFQQNTRLSSVSIPQRIDFYVLAYASLKDTDIFYNAQIFPLKNKDSKYLPADLISFDSWDKTLIAGGFRADINKVCTSARRFIEWHLAGFIAENELDEGDIIVRDGTLQTSVTGESEYTNHAYEQAKRKGVLFSGLAKTCTLFTDTGNSLASVIHQLGNKTIKTDPWFYNPVVDINHPDHKAELFFVKLHPESKYVFRYEINKDQIKELDKDDVGSVLSDLALNAKDICFPGYPYGLVDADRFARVQSWEVEQHRAMVLALLHDQGPQEGFDSLLSSINAHDMLLDIGGI
jgi:hypothetical protein